EIYIFGSVSNGNFHDGSDLDIAVKGLTSQNFFSVYGELMMRLSTPVDLVDITLQESFGKMLKSSGELLRVA
ncbi:MAG: nucleotidyltransferase domain-containing protein, partial [Spirochaetales bacterium]|nr:nucleotidyltransferase domain-containing protein [Spirochaetales bacterium]